MDKKAVVVFQGSIPSKKNSRINISDGRSFPSARYREWEEEARWRVKAAVPRPMEGEIELCITTSLRNDLDNLAASIMDALEGIAFENDRQVRRLVVERVTKKEKVTYCQICSSQSSGK